MYYITIESYKIEVEKKNVKTMRMTVSPNTGRIRISAPHHFDDKTIHAFVVSKLDWLKKHLSTNPQSKVPHIPKYEHGAIHYLAGKAYILNIHQSSDYDCYVIKLREDRYIDLYEFPETPAHIRPALFKEWHRIKLKARIAPMIKKWQEILGVKVSSWHVKSMKTKWGSCNFIAKRIWISLELAQRNDTCLELIIVHELMHLLERGHSARFKALMDRYLPDWREREELLKRALDEPEKQPLKNDF